MLRVQAVTLRKSEQGVVITPSYDRITAYNSLEIECRAVLGIVGRPLGLLGQNLRQIHPPRHPRTVKTSGGRNAQLTLKYSDLKTCGLLN